MNIKTIAVKAGLGNVYIVKTDNGAFLVDTGNKSFYKKILKALKSNNITPETLKFIFITHAHYDHAGSAAALAKETGAPVIIHQDEAEFLEKGFQPLPKGTSSFFKVMISAGKLMGKTFSGFPKVTPSITFDDEFYTEELLGINCKIIHTPGHTLGSSTLIIDNIAFVGDTVFNIWNNRMYPIFADDEILLKKSWKKLLSENVQFIYPAHGKRLDHRTLYKEAIKMNIV